MERAATGGVRPPGPARTVSLHLAASIAVGRWVVVSMCFAVPVSSVLLVAATERELCMVDGTSPVCCGIGPVEAGLQTAAALSSRATLAVLHVGIAGGRGLEPGTVVIGSESVYCYVLDPNATLPRVARLMPSPILLDTARRALPDALVLPIATAARVGGGDGHVVEAMEGFGVLRAATLARVPVIEIRVISNDPVDSDRRLWRTDHAIDVLHAASRTVVPAMVQLELGSGSPPLEGSRPPSPAGWEAV